MGIVAQIRSPALRATTFLACILAAAPVPAHDIRIAPLRDGDRACTAIVSGTRTTANQDALRFRLTTLDGRAVKLEPVVGGDADTFDYVAGDYRAPFIAAEYPDTASLQSAPIWQTMQAVDVFHLTAALRNGDYRSSTFEGFSPTALLDRMGADCGLVVDDPSGDLATLTSRERLFLQTFLRTRAGRTARSLDGRFSGADRDLLVAYLRANDLRPSTRFSEPVLASLMTHEGILLLPVYDEITPFSGDVAAVRKGRRWGMIRSDGTEIASARFADAKPPFNGLTPIRTRAGWTVLDASGNAAVDWSEPDLGDCSEGWCQLKSGDRTGYVNIETGRRLVPRYSAAGPFQGGFAAVKQRDTWSIISELGKPVRRLRGITGVLSPSSGVSRYVREGAVGFVTVRGDNPFSTLYRDARDFSGGLAAVLKGGKWGFIERRAGRLTIDHRFAETGDFSFGLAPATEDGSTWGLIDKSGSWVLSPAFAGVGDVSERYAVVTNANGKQALFSLGAKALVGPWVDEISPVSEGLAAFRSGKGWGLFRANALRPQT